MSKEAIPVKYDVKYKDEKDGKTYHGVWYRDGPDTITVSLLPCYGSKEGVKAGANPEVIAMIVLRELVQDAKRQGLLT